MANVWIENHGVFTVNDDKVQDLLSWLTDQGGAHVEGNTKDFSGQTLLNETNPPDDKKSYNKPATSIDEPKETDPDKTWDMGGTWM